MSTRLVIAYVVALCLASGGYVAAQEAGDPVVIEEPVMEDAGVPGEAAVGEGVSEPSAPEVRYANNAICPVSGEEVDEMGEPFEYEYNGTVYNFCCKMCLKDFNKDPEKYIQKLEEMEELDDDSMEIEEGMMEHEGHVH